MISETAPQNYVARRITSRDGLSLYVRDYDHVAGDHVAGDHVGGGKRVVLCLGGLTRNSKDFGDLAERLSDRHRIICVDYRGRGLSDYDPNWTNYTPPTYVDDICQIIAALNIHEIAVVGTSLGGLLAMGLGAAAPGALKGVLLNDVCPDLPVDMLASIVAYAGATPELEDWDAAKRYLRDNAPVSSAVLEDHIDDMVRNTFTKRSDGKIVFGWDTNIIKPLSDRRAAEMDLWPLFSSLKNIPLLSIRGGLSPFVTDQALQRMATVASNLSSVTVPGAGHAPTLTEDICHDAIDEWLSRCFEL